MAETTRKCPCCGADCIRGSGHLDQTGAPKPTTTWTCQASCGYKRWDALAPGEVTVEELPAGSLEPLDEKV